jgi:hypothetical protein
LTSVLEETVEAGFTKPMGQEGEKEEELEFEIKVETEESSPRVIILVVGRNEGKEEGLEARERKESVSTPK